ncbi:MAG TPA: DinB family protein [Vicinamibacterales bacterium]
MTTHNDAVRDHLARLLDWREAHVGFEAAVDGIGPGHRGKTPPGLPYSAWQILEHIRLAQNDILDFCVNSSYREKKWPDDYWPKNPAPPSDAAWDESVASCVRDRDALKQLVRDPKADLSAKIPHGTGQTYLREALLVADHTSYHVGQLVLVRRLLGIWPAA